MTFIAPAWRPWLLALGLFMSGRLLVAAGLLTATGFGLDVSPGLILGGWDGYYYVAVASHGYPHDAAVSLHDWTDPAARLAYFPLFPLLVAAFSALTPLSALGSALVLGSIFGVAAIRAVQLVGQELLDARAGWWAASVLALSPGTVVWSGGYAEPLFCLLAAWSLLALLRRQWLWAGMAGALCGLTRPYGLAVTLCCFIAALSAFRSQTHPRTWSPWLAPTVSALGVASFSLFCWWWTGEALAWQLVQTSLWGHQADFGTGFVRLLWFHPTPWSWMAAACVFLMIVGLIGLIAIDAPPFVICYSVAVVLPPVLVSTLTLQPRYLAVAFPIYIGLVARGRRLPLVGLLTALSFGLAMAAVVYTSGAAAAP